MKKRDVVLGGRGQVGGALCGILGGLAIDRGDEWREWKCEYLHVCVPWSEDFVWIVKNGVSRFKPEVVVIHSTVPVGTTFELNGGCMAVHSPVRGQHDDLEGSLRRFVKYVGSEDVAVGVRVCGRLLEAGIPAKYMGGSRDTELMKLLCLSRYLNEIAFYEKADGLCEKYGVDRAGLREWTRTYNEGYEGTRWKRGELEFPDGKVGGHCVGQVSRMLYEQTKDEWFWKNLKLFGLV